MSRPNVLLITIDQWRADSLSCAGHTSAVTPNLDALAARGVRFARHYAQAAPCGPSRASLLTGTYLHTHRSVSNGTPLSSSLTNVALEMRGAGYVPTLFGYTDTTVDPATVTDPDDPRLRTYEGILPGFDVEVNLPEHLEAWGEWLRGRGYDVEPGRVPQTMYRRQELADAEGRGATWAPTVYGEADTEAAFLVERFGEWLDRGESGAQPGGEWFAHVTFLRPHPPYMAPAPWNDLIDPATVPEPVRHATREEEGEQHPMVASAMFVDAARSPDSELDQRQFAATYWGMLAEVDHQLGRLLEHLDRNGSADDTLVIVTADHGEQLGDHWLKEKLGYFEQSYHVPLIVAGPTVSGGVVVDDFTESVDVMPTILGAAGVAVPKQCHGRSLATFLAGGRPDRWRDAAHWEWDFRDPRIAEVVGLELTQCSLAVLRDVDAKYVHFAGFGPAFYDLREDPGELHNLADGPDQRERMLTYAQRLLNWRMSSDDDRLASLLATRDGIVQL